MSGAVAVSNSNAVCDVVAIGQALVEAVRKAAGDEAAALAHPLIAGAVGIAVTANTSIGGAK